MKTDMHPDSARPGDETAHSRWQYMWSHREQLLKVARRRSMSAEDAEDAVQEAMLRAAENPHLDDARLGAWLTTVTMRLCVDRYRQVNREAEVRSTPKFVAPGPVPVEEAVCDRAEAKWLAFQSRELPARQAEALRLKAQDRDVGQVAREMGLSYEAVESLLARARRTLRNSLAGTLALTLWLCGRGRTQTGGNVQAVAAASTAAALAVVGLALPFAYEPDRPRPPQASEAVETPDAADVRDTAGHGIPPASSGPVGRAAAGSPARPVLPDSEAWLSRLSPMLPEVSVPKVPDAPKVATPEMPEMPVPAVTPTLPATAPPATPPLRGSAPAPDAQGDTTTRLPGDALHSDVRP